MTSDACLLCITNAGTLSFPSGNALTCGCDALWLLLDLNNLDKIKDSARCSDGTFFKDTDTDPLLISC